jgi:hypothetical protein
MTSKKPNHQNQQYTRSMRRGTDSQLWKRKSAKIEPACSTNAKNIRRCFLHLCIHYADMSLATVRKCKRQLC